MIDIISRSVIFENSLPQLQSRHSWFPFAAQLEDGTILASHVVGQAFESVDQTTYLSKSEDMGKTWKLWKPCYDKKNDPVSDYTKITCGQNGRCILFGMEYYRHDPSLPIGNPKTGGLLDSKIILLKSDDNGETWGNPLKFISPWGDHVEASAPVTILKDGSWASPVTCFPDWDGVITGRLCGRLARSFDEGETWNFDTVCMEFPDNDTYCYEQRICQLDSGVIVLIGWNEKKTTGERLENHYTYSVDGGRTFSKPQGTGIMGQASGITALGGEKLMVTYSIRRDTDKPGIFAHIIDFSRCRWDVLSYEPVWMPPFEVKQDKSMAETFAYLKFGQPCGILLKNGNVLMTNWVTEDGRSKTVATVMKVNF